jgi:hypothetical protein
MSEFFLERCPFCGGEAKLVRTSTGYAQCVSAITDRFLVRCSHCHSETESRPCDIRINGDGVVKVIRNGAEEAVQLWNNRTKSDWVVYPEERGEE